MRVIFFLGLLAMLAGCASRKTAVAAPPAAPSRSLDYIDLQPGSRLSVVTPILKSGGYKLEALERQTTGNNVTLSVASDFLGYETSYYAVKPRSGGGVEVVFTSAEVTKDGATTAQQRSIVPLFRLPRSGRYVRLIYLVRVSAADHNMAVVAANRIDSLEALTMQVKAHPAEGCKTTDRAFCAFIPDGIAVRIK